MAIYLISNKNSGHCFGALKGDSELEAYQALHRDAGEEAVPSEIPEEILVEEASYRVFQGRETGQLLVDQDGDRKPDAASWFWEPEDYEGDVIWDGPYPTEAEARAAAEAGHLWVK